MRSIKRHFQHGIQERVRESWIMCGIDDPSNQPQLKVLQETCYEFRMMQANAF